MTSIDDSSAEFDAVAGEYEAQLERGLSLSGESQEFFAKGRVLELQRWWSRSGLAPPARILDYGCGLGNTTHLLAAAFPTAEVLGVDPSERILERARSAYGAPRVRFARPTDGEEPAPPSHLIYLNGVVHHVPPRQRPAFFRNLASRLAPGGVIALYENNPLNPGTRWVMSRIPFDRDAVTLTPWETRSWLQGVALCPVTTRYLFFFPRFLRAFRVFERPLVHLALGAQYGVFARASGPRHESDRGHDAP